MIQCKSFTVKQKEVEKMDRESYLYMRARRSQKTACVEGKKNWDINYVVKIIEEWEKMQGLFKGVKR